MRAEAIELGDRIAEQAANLDAAMARLLGDLRRFDACGYWHQAGARSCAHWLSWQVSWDLATSREHVRVARRLGELPAVEAALARGALSYAKVRAITRVATPSTEQTLLEYAASRTTTARSRSTRRPGSAAGTAGRSTTSAVSTCSGNDADRELAV